KKLTAMGIDQDAKLEFQSKSNGLISIPMVEFFPCMYTTGDILNRVPKSDLDKLPALGEVMVKPNSKKYDWMFSVRIVKNFYNESFHNEQIDIYNNYVVANEAGDF